MRYLTVLTLVLVGCGKPGAQGPQGAPGIPGEAAQPCTVEQSAQVSPNEMVIVHGVRITCPDGSQVFIPEMGGMRSK